MSNDERYKQLRKQYEEWRKSMIEKSGDVSEEEFLERMKSLSVDGDKPYRLEAYYDERTNRLTLRGNARGLIALRGKLDALMRYGAGGDEFLAKYHGLSDANISIHILSVDDE